MPVSLKYGCKIHVFNIIVIRIDDGQLVLAETWVLFSIVNIAVLLLSGRKIALEKEIYLKHELSQLNKLIWL